MVLTPKQVAEHNTQRCVLQRHSSTSWISRLTTIAHSSCWVIIEKKVYDVTDFVPQHPGGPRMILNFAGRDATSAFKAFHSTDVIAANIPPHKHIGVLGS
ncbi:cytochrome b5 [Daedalea quercina L-15889]|uniref:Cytochrome b5 n=1 Tax=Daedalea quercina L-15889 TaxID=1314783 RepID=A0A165LGV1_9APHY|nr:cytochrome b5 [Daedalea quercina L-15889]